MPVSPKPKSCQGCPAYRLPGGFVPSSGPSDAEVVVVGQGPGRDEAILGKPFVGPSGMRLDRWLRRAGWQRSELLVTNVVWCHLPGNRPPTAEERRICWSRHLGPLIHSAPRKLVIAVGVPAHMTFIPERKARVVGGISRQPLPPLEAG